MAIATNEILQLWFRKLELDENFFDKYELPAQCVLINLPELANYLHEIHKLGAKIVLASDFDTDGIMSSVIGFAALTELGFNAGLYAPKPSEGYGLRVCDIDRIKTEHPDASVILTADVGIAANDAIMHARNLGMRVLVTDHHIATFPCAADIAVNPNQCGESYDQPNICGAFVLYKIFERYASLFVAADKQLYIYNLRLFAGIATIADLMPLVGENRLLVNDSVSLLRSFYKDGNLGYDNGQSVFTGIVALLNYLKEAKKLKSADDIDETFLGFYLIPLLNSIKRMGADIRAVYDMFFCRPGLANKLRIDSALAYIADMSEQRRSLTAQWFDEIRKGDFPDECNVYITGASPGFHGLLATQIMNLTGMPVLVISHDTETGEYHGSGRSPAWFDFPKSITEAGLELTAAGHAGAFGVSCPSTQALDEYRDFYREVIEQAYVDAAENYKTPEIVINCGVDCDESEYDFDFDAALLREYLDEYELFRPWGVGFEPPKFKLLIDAGFKARIFGAKKQHAKFITDEGLEVLLFNKSHLCKGLGDDKGYISGVIFATGQFVLNCFNGAESLNFFADSVCRAESEVRVR